MEKLLNLHGLETFYHEKVKPKAEVDGYYSEMTVGDAEQLVATQYVEDSEPYLFRTTGGSVDVGNREYVDEIVGGTVGWNQRIETRVTSDTSQTLNGITVTSKANGSIVINGTATADTWLSAFSSAKIPTVRKANTAGHKLLYLYSSTHNFRGRQIGDTNIGYLVTNDYNAVIVSRSESSSTADGNVQIGLNNGDSFSNVAVYPIMVDLTQLFGSTIADYIYSLETATAGAGVAFFRKLFPKDYYSYNAGELISVSGLSSHDTVGFNQWDTSTDNENRVILNDGTLGINSAYYVSDYIRVLPSTTYYFKDVSPSANTNSIAEYDAGKNFIRIQTVSGASGTNVSGTKVMSDNTYYIRVTRFKTSNDVCINLSWSGYRNGEYEEYQKHSYALDDSLTLRGIPKLDSSNKLYYDGDTYASNGTVTRKYGIVDLGTLNWTKNWGTGDPTGVFYSPTLDYLNVNGDVINKNYIFRKGANPNTMEDKSITLFGSNRFYVKDTSYTDATAFKTAMSGVYLVYELATPTTESAEPYQQVQICDDFGTEEFVSTSIVPVGHNTRYPDNLRDKLQHLPSLAGADGYYMISQQNNSMSLELFRIPKAPTEDGTYVLRASVSGGTPTYTWEAVE